MIELTQSIEEIEVADLLPIVVDKMQDGWRLDQICAVSFPDRYELTYSFAKDDEYRFINYRLVISPETVVPSITSIYSCAVFHENELAELFGVKINRVENNFKGKLYRIDAETPFK